MSKTRKLVKQMVAGAISFVPIPANKNSNFLVVQAAPNSATPEEDVFLGLCAQAADLIGDAPEMAQKMQVIDALMVDLRNQYAPRPIMQGVTEEWNEMIARGYGWSEFQAFQEYVMESVTTPEQMSAAIDEFAALLKEHLTAPGDGDGDEPPGMTCDDDSMVAQGASPKEGTVTDSDVWSNLDVSGETNQPATQSAPAATTPQAVTQAAPAAVVTDASSATPVATYQPVQGEAVVQGLNLEELIKNAVAAALEERLPKGRSQQVDGAPGLPVAQAGGEFDFWLDGPFAPLR